MNTPKPPMPDAPASEALWSLPYPLLVVDDDLRVHHQNAATRDFLSPPERAEAGQKCGEVLRCLHALRADDCCGTTEYCPTCVVRNSLTEALRELSTVQARATIQRGPDADHSVHMLITAVAYECEAGRLAVMMLQDIPKLAVSAGLVPMCAACHRMCDELGVWHDLSVFLSRKHDLVVSHTLCPDCGPNRRNR
jgi:hypothetical protein